MSELVEVEELLPGLFRFGDTCNVYLMTDGRESVAIDFGSGRWMQSAVAMGLPPVSHVYLTHHHRDQCWGLQDLKEWPFAVHASNGERMFLEADGVRELHASVGGPKWFPKSYDLLERGLPEHRIAYDMGCSGFAYHFGNVRINFLETPGHGCFAMSVVTEFAGRNIAFCGDAVHADATIWQLYNLEWDHWTASGAKAASEGVRRLHNIGLDLLLPSHGPVIGDDPRGELAQLLRKLEAFIAAKGCPCAGEPDRYVPPVRVMKCGAVELLPGLYWFQNGGYLLLSSTGEGFVTDPTVIGISDLDRLLAELGGNITITALVVTHVHADHMNGVEILRERYGSRLYLHPWVADILGRGGVKDVPYIQQEAIQPDVLWPEEGEWQWNEYCFRIAPMPGQAWWHCGFMTTVAGRRVLFGGDTFQPPSRWNGTGGFCSINGCHFSKGVRRSAETVLEWKPDIIVNGHATWMYFAPSYFNRVIEWSTRAEEATVELCPGGDIDSHYYLHQHPDQEN